MQNRIIQIMKNFGLNAGQFADKLGLQPSNVSHVLAGRNKPSLDFVTRILNAFPQINYQWLMMGKGSMLILDTDNQSKNSQSEHQNSFEKTLFSESEPEAEQQTALFVQDDLATTQNNNEPAEKPYVNEQQKDFKDETKSMKSYDKDENADNRQVKRIDRILVLYNDGTFEER